MNAMREYEEIIRSRVCTECLLPSGAGMCGTGLPEECPLNRFLPRAVDAVNLGKSKSIIEYFKSLHEKDGDEGEDDRVISGEDALWLKEFLPLIELAVEELRGKEKKRKLRSRIN